MRREVSDRQRPVNRRPSREALVDAILWLLERNRERRARQAERAEEGGADVA